MTLETGEQNFRWHFNYTSNLFPKKQTIRTDIHKLPPRDHETEQCNKYRGERWQRSIRITAVLIVQ